ncbi:unnamed protein product [Closterium sp. Naga37s-1]|nr:unnamed protein product [Closterium sp. Naga37s-1]
MPTSWDSLRIRLPCSHLSIPFPLPFLHSLQRPDTEVVDEPLYADFLAVTGAAQPSHTRLTPRSYAHTPLPPHSPPRPSLPAAPRHRDTEVVDEPLYADFLTVTGAPNALFSSSSAQTRRWLMSLYTEVVDEPLYADFLAATDTVVVDEPLYADFLTVTDTEVVDEPLYADYLVVTGAANTLHSPQFALPLPIPPLFLQRPDTEVVDEPLYAHFLAVTGAPRPYRQLVLDSMDANGMRVVDQVVYGPRGSNPLRFVKHMAKQCREELQASLLSRGRHVILIRDPMLLIPSFGEVSPPSLSETALPHLLAIHSSLSHMGRSPPVIDATRLQSNPQGVLMALCQALDIPFYPEMLSWPAGKRPEDGVWAPWWYSTTHASTGFAPPALYPKPFPMEHYSLLEDCRPFYSLLRSKALVPLTTTSNSSNNSSTATTGTTTPTTISPYPSASPLPSPPLPVPANQQLLVWVGEEGLVPRRDAKIHVLDSAVQGGDAVWEGLRVYDGRVFKLQEHLDRLFDSAKAMAFANVPTREHVVHALVSTLAANGMRDNAHVRLTLTRGKKTTSGMSPQFNLYGCTLIVLAEWKPPVYDNTRGIKLITASTRRNSPQCVDSHIHHNNLINNILAKIEGNNAGADDAVMLDVHGYVSETNATNIFMVKRGRILTPHADSCLPGITRATVIELARQEGIPIQECNITTAQLHAADEEGIPIEECNITTAQLQAADEVRQNV